MNKTLDRIHRSRLTAVLAGAALLTLGGVGATAHAADVDPQLSITVDDGSTAAQSGDRLGYTVTLTNLGTKKVRDLRVSQTVPAGASFVSADLGGDQSKGTIDWSVDLAAAEKITVHSTMALRTTPDSTLRLATVACAQVSVAGPALVCASDSDQLPAGAAIERAESDAVPAADGWLDGRTSWYLSGGAAVLLAGAGVALARRRRSSRQP